MRSNISDLKSLLIHKISFWVQFHCRFYFSLDNASNPRPEKFPRYENGSIIPRLFKKGGYLDAWKGVEEAKRQGLAKPIGVSNFNQHQLTRVLEIAQFKPVINQVCYLIFQLNPVCKIVIIKIFDLHLPKKFILIDWKQPVLQSGKISQILPES